MQIFFQQVFLNFKKKIEPLLLPHVIFPNLSGHVGGVSFLISPVNEPFGKLRCLKSFFPFQTIASHCVVKHVTRCKDGTRTWSYSSPSSLPASSSSSPWPSSILILVTAIVGTTAVRINKMLRSRRLPIGLNLSISGVLVLIGKEVNH